MRPMFTDPRSDAVLEPPLGSEEHEDQPRTAAVIGLRWRSLLVAFAWTGCHEPPDTPFLASLSEAWSVPVEQIPGRAGPAQVLDVELPPAQASGIAASVAVALNRSYGEFDSGAIVFYEFAEGGFAPLDGLFLAVEYVDGVESIAIDDLDADGTWDLVVAQQLGPHEYGDESEPHRLTVHRGGDDPSFVSSTDLSTVATSHVVTGDLTGDGAPEIGAIVDGVLTVWANDGAGGMGALAGTQRQAEDLAAGAAESGASVLLDGGTSGVVGYAAVDGWGPAFAFGSSGVAGRGFVASDADLDGDLDVALNLGQGGFELWADEGDAMEKRWDLPEDRCFHAGLGRGDTEIASRSCALAAVDLDGDGYEDLVSVDGDGLTVLANRGGRGYDIVQTVPGTWSVLDTGDVDRDGDSDVVAGGIFDLTVFLNEAPSPP